MLSAAVPEAPGVSGIRCPSQVAPQLIQWPLHMEQNILLAHPTCDTRAPWGSCPWLGHQEAFLIQVAHRRLSHQPHPYSTSSSRPFSSDLLCCMLEVVSPASRAPLDLDPKGTSGVINAGEMVPSRTPQSSVWQQHTATLFL